MRNNLPLVQVETSVEHKHVAIVHRVGADGYLHNAHVATTLDPQQTRPILFLTKEKHTIRNKTKEENNAPA